MIYGRKINKVCGNCNWYGPAENPIYGYCFFNPGVDPETVGVSQVRKACHCFEAIHKCENCRRFGEDHGNPGKFVCNLLNRPEPREPNDECNDFKE